MKLITFKINGEVLGLPSDYVYRVVDHVTITPVCLMPSFYLGLLHYRGELFDVLDIGLLLNKGKAAFSESRRLMIIRWAGRKMAVAPGFIRGLVWIDGDDAEETSITQGGQAIRVLTPKAIWDRVLEKHNAVPDDCGSTIVD